MPVCVGASKEGVSIDRFMLVLRFVYLEVSRVDAMTAVGYSELTVRVTTQSHADIRNRGITRKSRLRSSGNSIVLVQIRSRMPRADTRPTIAFSGG